MRRILPIRARRAAVAFALAAGVALVTALPAAQSRDVTPYNGYEPYTPWRRPPIRIPQPSMLNYVGAAEEGVWNSWHWRDGRWLCEFLRCTHGPYPLTTIWGEVGMFQAIDALQIASPTRAHHALLVHFARENERYWDRRLGGYAPYPGDREHNVRAFFDDNGWEGLAFFEAYVATGEHRWLYDAQRAFRFIARRGWDPRGGGIWWNTWHPYHSGPALAASTLLGTLLYYTDHEAWQLADVVKYVWWANNVDSHDERRMYLEQPTKPNSVLDYVESPLIYAQYLLCANGQGGEYCTRAGRLSATLAEEFARNKGGHAEWEYNYGPQYDAIFLQWMMAYGQSTGNTFWLHVAQLNAESAAQHARNRGGLLLNSWWGGPIQDPETQPNLLRTAGATTSLFAWLAVYSGL